MKTKIKVGGVPEHFNLPWHLAIEDGAFDDAGIELIWKTQPGGTGAMTKGLESGDLDLAVVLTEGISAAIIKGNPSQLIQQYVRSPLIWGIHAPADSKYNGVHEIQDARFAISRNGSGSHIMAYVLAENQGWEPTDLNFEIVGNFDGALQAFKKDEADIILWEKFTTKPFVDKGTLKRIGQTITPWSCFMIAARNEILEKEENAVRKVLSIIRKYCHDFMLREDAVELVAERYGLQLQDAAAWYRQTGWATNNYVPEKMLKDVIKTLYDVKVIDSKPEVKTLCHEMLWFDRLVE